MKILVTTPAGNIGKRVLAELLAPEFSVRVITRDPATLSGPLRARVEVVRGSTDDATTMRRALQNVEALFWCAPPVSTQETSPRAHFERFGRAASQAIRETGTRRVVSISAGGKWPAWSEGPISGLRAMEDILNQSGALIRHLRCASFMENFLGQVRQIGEHGILSCPMPEHIPIPMVAAADIADVALRWLARRDWAGIECLPVHGPEDLSCGQAAAIIGRVLGRPVRYREASVNHYVQALVRSGTSPEQARSLVDMFAELAQGIGQTGPHTAESATPTTLAAWVETELAPLVAPRGSPSRQETACTAGCGI
jgi:uncharacterized protein YbjT (DUF2867 family)